MKYTFLYSAGPLNKQTPKENDIAIVTLSKPVPAGIRRVKLELPSNETYVNREGTVVGWGMYLVFQPFI